MVGEGARRRDVRPTRSFYDDLYRHFRLERGPAGEPSRVDFELYELPRLFRDVADQWDGMFQPIPGRPDYRIFISFGILVAALSVEAQLAADGAIELLSLEVDPYPASGDEDGDR